MEQTSISPTQHIEHAIDRALMAAHSYRKYENSVALPFGWKKLCTSDDLRDQNSPTSFQGMVYGEMGQDGKIARYVISFCGFESADDIRNVLQAGFYGLPDDLADAYAFTAAACRKFGIMPDKLEFVGHSLGGYLAKAIGPRWGATAVWSFNSPGFKEGDAEALDEFFKGRPRPAAACTPSMNIINSRYDLVGMWGHQPGRVTELETAGNHHNMQELLRALVEKMSISREFCLVSRKHEDTPGLFRKAAREICDRIGKSALVRQALVTKFTGDRSSTLHHSPARL